MSERYRFGEFTLDVTERRVSRGDAPVALPPKMHDVLVVLVRRAGRLVTKRELLDAVWADAFVEEGIVSVHIAGLRKALGDASFIETVSKSGYRFVGPVAEMADRKPGRLGLVDPAPARSPEVYEHCGRGRLHLLSSSMVEAPRAAAEFEAAIAIDSTYAPAHAGLALAWCAHASLRVVPHADAYGRAKAAALRALAMDDGSADAQTALGCVLFLSEWDWTGAARSLDRSLDLEPSHTQAQLLRGQLFEAVGQLDAGLAMKQRALERDPFAPHVLLQISLSYWNRRRYDESLEWATKALAIDPRLLLAREHVAGVYWKIGDFERMMAENVTQAESFGAPPEMIDRIRELGREVARASDAGGRLSVMRLLRQFASQQTQPAAAIQMAVLSGEVGDLDAAFRHLDRALESRDPSLVHLAVAPQWDSLRGDPRMADRLARMGLNLRNPSLA